MYVFLVVIHVLASLFLIIVILLQAGRGGGLSESLGASQMQNTFGTKSANVLARVTAVCAAIFIIASLSLAIISSHRSRSIVDKISSRIPVNKVVTQKDVQKPIEKANGTVDKAKKMKTEPVKEGSTGE